ncbi:MAG: hypothetical protein V4538_17220 [Bacteroidota bacterium]
MVERGIFKLKLHDGMLVGNYSNEHVPDKFYPKCAMPLYKLNTNDIFIGSFKCIWFEETIQPRAAILEINRYGFMYMLTWISEQNNILFHGLAERIDTTLYGAYMLA